MLLIKRFIDIDELCIEASKRSKNERRVSNFKFRSSSSVVDCDFAICVVVVEMFPIELSCIHELKETFVIA